MKNSFHGLISLLDIAKEGISELEDVRNWKAKIKKTERRMERNIQELWDSYKEERERSKSNI